MLFTHVTQLLLLSKRPHVDMWDYIYIYTLYRYKKCTDTDTSAWVMHEGLRRCKKLSWLNVWMWTHSAIPLWKPTHFCDWIVVAFSFFFASQHLTKSTIVYFITGGEIRPCTSAELRWRISLISVTLSSLYTQSGRCTSPKSSACCCCSHLSASHPLQTSRMLLALICDEQLHSLASIPRLPCQI